MKIAFTSCANLQDFPSQFGWTRIKELEPDVLLLLGDQIYMDFGITGLGGDLYSPRKFSIGEFAFRMYDRYRRQFAETHFQDLLRSRPNMQIAATWDDHDFAWNNACGGRCPEPPGPGETATRISQDGKMHKASSQHKAIARILFTGHLKAMRERLSPDQYPSPVFDFTNMPVNLPLEVQGIQEAFDLENGAIRVVMLDTRYHRDCVLYPEARIMEPAQMDWLRDQLSGPQDLTLICSGSTLTAGECWKDYPQSLDELKHAVAGKKVLVLSGDIHQNAFHAHKNPHDNSRQLFEATASGLAIEGMKPFLWLGDQVNYGLLELDEQRLSIQLYRKSGKCNEHLIDRADWRDDTPPAFPNPESDFL
jgi:hypothetical protein